MRLLLPISLALALTACNNSTSTGVDAAKVIDAIKSACGIAVVAASVADIIQKDPTMSISAITNLVCTGFKSANANGKLGSGPTAHRTFDVVVNGQTVTVELQ